jgi:hypothetical protein
MLWNAAAPIPTVDISPSPNPMVWGLTGSGSHYQIRFRNQGWFLPATNFIIDIVAKGQIRDCWILVGNPVDCVQTVPYFQACGQSMLIGILFPDIVTIKADTLPSGCDVTIDILSSNPLWGPNVTAEADQGPARSSAQAAHDIQWNLAVFVIFFVGLIVVLEVIRRNLVHMFRRS